MVRMLSFKSLLLLFYGLVLSEATSAAFLQKKLVTPTEELVLIKEIEWPPNDSMHLWYWVPSMDVTKDCSLLALFNTKPPRVSILNARTLNLISTFGRKGKGPGELDDFFAWIGFKDDTLFVVQDHRISLFLANGRYLDMDLPAPRTATSILAVARTTGIDKDGNVYYWTGGPPSSEYLIRRKNRNSRDEFLIRSDEFDSQGKAFDIYCGVVKSDGSIIIALAQRPIVAKYSPTGSRAWLVDLLSEVPLLRASYKKVKAREILSLYSAFWVDDTYVILTFADDEIRIGQPKIFYLFLDTRTGAVRKLTYAAQNIVRSLPDPDGFYEAQLYNPWAVAHCNGTLYVFSKNSARVLVYRLAWHE